MTTVVICLLVTVVAALASPPPSPPPSSPVNLNDSDESMDEELVNLMDRFDRGQMERQRNHPRPPTPSPPQPPSQSIRVIRVAVRTLGQAARSCMCSQCSPRPSTSRIEREERRCRHPERAGLQTISTPQEPAPSTSQVSSAPSPAPSTSSAHPRTPQSPSVLEGHIPCTCSTCTNNERPPGLQLDRLLRRFEEDGVDFLARPEYQWRHERAPVIIHSWMEILSDVLRAVQQFSTCTTLATQLALAPIVWSRIFRYLTLRLSDDNRAMRCLADGCGAPFYNIARPPQGMAEEDEEEETDFECPVCLEQNRHLCTLVSCGHVFCITCAYRLSVCPICRRAINGRFRLYFGG